MDTLATELLKQQKVNFKRLFIVLLVVIGLWFATIGGFIVYLSLPSEVTQSSVEQQADDGASNQIVGGDFYGNPTEDNANGH